MDDNRFIMNPAAAEKIHASIDKYGTSAIPPDLYVQLEDNLRPAIASKVWKVECPACCTNWVYDEDDSSVPDECENCGRVVEVRESWETHS